jgi:hypothetical protein
MLTQHPELRGRLARLRDKRKKQGRKPKSTKEQKLSEPEPEPEPTTYEDPLLTFKLEEHCTPPEDGTSHVSFPT